MTTWEMPSEPGSEVTAVGDRNEARRTADRVLDEFAADVLRRCRWAQAHNGGHPSCAWSTGEQLAVALVLGDREHLTGMDYTPTQAAQRVLGGMANPPTDINAWLAAIRTGLTTQRAVRASWEMPPEPGPEVSAVRDRRGVRWRREDIWWWADIGHGYEVNRTWPEVLARGPLTDASGEES